MKQSPAQPVTVVGVGDSGGTLWLPASGVGLALMGAAGIWWLDAGGIWLIVSIGVLALGAFIAGVVLVYVLFVVTLTVGAAVVIIPVVAFWESIRAIGRWIVKSVSVKFDPNR